METASLSFPRLRAEALRRGGGNPGFFLRFLDNRLHMHGGQYKYDAKRDFPMVPISTAARLLGRMVKQKTK